MKAFIQVLLGLSLTQLAHASTFTVDTTNGTNLNGCAAAPGDCSFNGAIARANSSAGPDLVAFNIPMTDPGCVAATGVCRISFTTAPVTVTDSVTIDGYTQAGALANTLSPEQGGSNAQIKIELRGCPACANGVVLSALGTVRGLAIGGFTSTSGISFDSNTSNGSAVEGSFLGTDATGTVAVPNVNGVSANGNPFAGAQPQNVRVGGSLPAQRNLISGNSNNGIEGNASNFQIIGNLIGTDVTGLQALPNQVVGVFVAGCGNGSGANARIGGLSVAERNVISGNGSFGVQIGLPNGGCGNTVGALIRGNYIGSATDGVGVIGNGLLDAFQRGNVLIRTPGTLVAPNIIGGSEAGAANLIVGGVGSGAQLQDVAFSAAIANRIRGNRKLGIDALSNAIREPNDSADTNTVQNFPAISSFNLNAGTANLAYSVDSAPSNAVYPLRIDFYKAVGDEGFDYLGSDSYTALQAQSQKTIALAVSPSVSLTPDDVIVATALDAEFSQSEFSFHPITLLIDVPVPSSCGGNVHIFCDAFESDPQRSLEVAVRATSTVFKPNGNVRLSDNRGASCELILTPSSTALTSAGRCVLVNSGAPGPITITAEYDTFSGAFANPLTGANVTTSASFTVPSN